MRAHRTDPVSLAFGLVFLAGAGFWLTARLVTLDPPAIGWFLAGTLIVLGGTGLVHALTAGRRPRD